MKKRDPEFRVPRAAILVLTTIPLAIVAAGGAAIAVALGWR